MPIEFACVSCAKLLRVPDGSGGAQCQCPACRAIVEIPDPEAIGIVEVDSRASKRSSNSKRIQVNCPRCEATLQCERNLLGTKGQCRRCKYIFLISKGDASGDESSQGSPAGLIFECPKCSQLFEGSREMQGRKGKCHVCGEVFPIVLKEASESDSWQQSEQSSASKERLTPSLERRQAQRESSVVPSESKEVASDQARRQARASIPRAKPANFQVACPSCQDVMEVSISACGQQVACPHCDQLLEIPEFDIKETKASVASIEEPPGAAVTSSFDDAGLWDALPDPSLDSGQGALENPFEPVGSSSLVGQDWQMPTAARKRRGVSFSNVFGLVFERAFPNCLAGALAYALTVGVGTGLIYASLFLVSALLRALQIQDPAVATTLAVICLGISGIAATCIGTLGFCMLCNNALTNIRSRKGNSSELFSTGGAFGPMLIYVFVLALAGGLVGYVPQAILQLFGPSAGLPAWTF